MRLATCARVLLKRRPEGPLDMFQADNKPPVRKYAIWWSNCAAVAAQAGAAAAAAALGCYGLTECCGGREAARKRRRRRSMLLRACAHRMSNWPGARIGARRTFAKMAQRVADPFEVLGVPPTATLEEARRAFRDKAMQNHPDSNHGPEAHVRMQDVNAAWVSVRAILARVDTPELRTATAERQQQEQQPGQQEQEQQQQEQQQEQQQRRQQQQQPSAEREASAQSVWKQAKAKDRMASEKLKRSKTEASRKQARGTQADKDAKAKRVTEAAEAAQRAELEREAMLITNASDAAQAKVAAKRGWLAYYAHVSAMRRLRENALSWPPLSVQRTTGLNLIEALEDDGDSSIVGYAAFSSVFQGWRFTRYHAFTGIINPSLEGLDRIGALRAIFHCYHTVRAIYDDVTSPPSKPGRRR